MQPIDKPQLLDPDRIVDPSRDDMTVDHESLSKELREALRASCDYGQQLWDHLDAVRHYLMNSLPPDPRAAGPHMQLGAHPAGPDDAEGWQHWVDIYASVTSVMAGPHGDAGYGYGEARDAARIRTEAPNTRLAARLQQEVFTNSAAPADGARRKADRAAMLRGLALAGLGLLALRGLRPRG